MYKARLNSETCHYLEVISSLCKIRWKGINQWNFFPCKKTHFIWQTGRISHMKSKTLHHSVNWKKTKWHWTLRGTPTGKSDEKHETHCNEAWDWGTSWLELLKETSAILCPRTPCYSYSKYIQNITLVHVGKENGMIIWIGLKSSLSEFPLPL